MKKLIIFFAIALIGIKSNAQWGAKVGANFSNFSGGDAADERTLIGFYGGFFYNAVINKSWSVEPQLLYSGAGAKHPDQNDVRLRLTYLTLTPLVRYNLASGLFFGTGPEFGLLLSAKLKDNNTSVDVKDLYKSFAFAWAFAVGYQMHNGFGIYGRYNLGLSNILDASDADLKNSVFQIGFRFMLEENKK